jgi:hypothetical protein
VGNIFRKLKDWIPIATPYDRCAHTFFSAICIAATGILYLNLSVRTLALSSLEFDTQFSLQLNEELKHMRKRIHDWMDDWFLSLSDNPDNLDKAIKNYEGTRMISVICFFIVVAVHLLIVFKSNNSADYGFTFSLVVFMLVMLFHIDNYTKLLKLQRRNQKNNRLPNN